MADKTQDALGEATEAVGGLGTAADSDAAIINSGPAIYCNKIFTTVTPGGLRLTFAEVNPAQPDQAVFRAAIMLSFPDVAGMTELLQQQLAFMEQTFREQFDTLGRGDAT